MHIIHLVATTGWDYLFLVHQFTAAGSDGSATTLRPFSILSLMVHSLAEWSTHIDALICISIHLWLSLSLTSKLIVIISAVWGGVILDKCCILILISNLFHKVVVLWRIETSTTLLSSILSGRYLIAMLNACGLSDALHILCNNVILAHHRLLLCLVSTLACKSASFRPKIVVRMLLTALRMICRLHIIHIAIKSVVVRSGTQIHIYISTVTQFWVLLVSDWGFVKTLVLLHYHGLARGWHNFLLIKLRRSSSSNIVVNTWLWRRLHIIDENGIWLINMGTFLGRSVVIHIWKTALGVLSTVDAAHLVVFGVKTTSDSTLLNSISRVLDLLLILIDHILLELRIILCIFDLYLLHACVVWVASTVVVWVLVEMLISGGSGLFCKHLVTSTNWPHTLVFGLLLRGNTYSIILLRGVWLFLLLLHLTIESFSLIEDLHKFTIHFVAVQLLKDIFLMFKLILRLFGLLRSLLLLNHGVCILWLISLGWYLLSVRLSSLFALRSLLCLTTICIGTLLLHSSSSCLLLSLATFKVLIVLSSNTQTFLIVVVLVDNMHTLTLIWKPIHIGISTILSYIGATLWKVLAQQSHVLLLLVGLRLRLQSLLWWLARVLVLLTLLLCLWFTKLILKLFVWV